jgi:uncharacterized protein YjbI with pentapeptide repeats
MKHRRSVEAGSWSVRAGRGAARSGAVLALVAWAGAAEAKCQDAPKPGIDWSGCSKARLMLTNENLTGVNLTRSLLTLSDFAASKMAGAKLGETEVSRTRFEGADLSQAGAPISGRPSWPAPSSPPPT